MRNRRTIGRKGARKRTVTIKKTMGRKIVNGKMRKSIEGKMQDKLAKLFVGRSH